MRKKAFAVLILVILGNVGAWAWWNCPVAERSWAGAINGVGYTPFHPNKSPSKGDKASADDIEKDMIALEGAVKGVRTYSATDGSELVAPIAKKYGLPVLAGAGSPESRKSTSRKSPRSSSWRAPTTTCAAFWSATRRFCAPT